VSGTCVAGADAGYDVEVIYYTAAATGTYYIVTDSGEPTGDGPSEYRLDCPPYGCYWGACCVGTNCYFDWSGGSQCFIDGGVYQGDGTDCDPNPCEETPIQPTTWGRIRTMFR
jgi:hypothetical protein